MKKAVCMVNGSGSSIDEIHTSSRGCSSKGVACSSIESSSASVLVKGKNTSSGSVATTCSDVVPPPPPTTTTTATNVVVKRNNNQLQLMNFAGGEGRWSVEENSLIPDEISSIVINRHSDNYQQSRNEDNTECQPLTNGICNDTVYTSKDGPHLENGQFTSQYAHLQPNLHHNIHNGSQGSSINTSSSDLELFNGYHQNNNLANLQNYLSNGVGDRVENTLYDQNVSCEDQILEHANKTKINNNACPNDKPTLVKDGMEEYFKHCQIGGDFTAQVASAVKDDSKTYNIEQCVDNEVVVTFNGEGESATVNLTSGDSQVKPITTTTITTATIKGGTTREVRAYNTDRLNLLNGDDYEDEDGCIYTYKEVVGIEDNLLDHLLTMCVSCGLPNFDGPGNDSNDLAKGPDHSPDDVLNIASHAADVNAGNAQENNLFSPDMDFLEMDFDPGSNADDLESSDYDDNIYPGLKLVVKADSGADCAIRGPPARKHQANNLSPERRSLILCRRCENDANIVENFREECRTNTRAPFALNFSTSQSVYSGLDDRPSCIKNKSGAISKKIENISPTKSNDSNSIINCKNNISHSALPDLSLNVKLSTSRFTRQQPDDKIDDRMSNVGNVSKKPLKDLEEDRNSIENNLEEDDYDILDEQGAEADDEMDDNSPTDCRQPSTEAAAHPVINHAYDAGSASTFQQSPSNYNIKNCTPYAPYGTPVSDAMKLLPEDRSLPLNGGGLLNVATPDSNSDSNVSVSSKCKCCSSPHSCSSNNSNSSNSCNSGTNIKHLHHKHNSKKSPKQTSDITITIAPKSSSIKTVPLHTAVGASSQCRASTGAVNRKTVKSNTASNGNNMNKDTSKSDNAVTNHCDNSNDGSANNNLGSLSAPEVSPAHEHPHHDKFKRSISFHNQLSSPKYDNNCFVPDAGMNSNENNVPPSVSAAAQPPLSQKQCPHSVCPNIAVGESVANPNNGSDHLVLVPDYMRNLRHSHPSNEYKCPWCGSPRHYELGRQSESNGVTCSNGNNIQRPSNFHSSGNDVNLLKNVFDECGHAALYSEDGHKECGFKRYFGVTPEERRRATYNHCVKSLRDGVNINNMGSSAGGGSCVKQRVSEGAANNMSACSSRLRSREAELFNIAAHNPRAQSARAATQQPHCRNSCHAVNNLTNNSNMSGSSMCNSRSGTSNTTINDSSNISGNVRPSGSSSGGAAEATTTDAVAGSECSNTCEAKLSSLVLKGSLPPKTSDPTIDINTTPVCSSNEGTCEESCPRIQEKVMVWTERQATARQVLQQQRSACGLSAAANVLLALEQHIQPIRLSEHVTPRQRAEGGTLVEYLVSRSCAGTTHHDLIHGMTRATNGSVVAKFFPMFPKRAVQLSKWLASWISKGGVCVCTLNLQCGVSAGEMIPDAWHHQMVFGVGPQGVYLTNPVECVGEEVISSQLCSERVLLVRRQDVIRHWHGSQSLHALLTQPDPRWRDMNVLGQVSLVLKEDMSACLRHGIQRGRQYMTAHVAIPASYHSGITVFMRADNPHAAALLAAEDLPLLE